MGLIFGTGLAAGVADGASYTFNGSGFGTKSTAAPMLSDRFESGSSGTELSTSADIGTWVVPSLTDTIQYNNAEAYSGTNACRMKFGATNGSGSGPRCTDPNGSYVLYGSYYIKVKHLSGDTSRNMKMMRFSADENSHTPDPTLGELWDDDAPTERYFHSNFESVDAALDMRPIDEGTKEWGSNGQWVYTALPSYDVWRRVEYYCDLGTENTADGTVYFYEDYAVLAGSSGYELRDTGDTLGFEAVFMPFYVAQDPGGEYEIYIDDVYLDTTCQRVEIGDNATWASITKREVQRATSWSDTSVTFTVNKGTLASGTNHIHIVNDDLTTQYVGTIELA